MALNLFKRSFVEFLKHTGWMPQVQEVLQRWNQAAESWEVGRSMKGRVESTFSSRLKTSNPLSSSLIAEFFTKKGSYNTVSCCVLFMMYSLYIQVLLLNHLTDILKSTLGNCACSTINSLRL